MTESEDSPPRTRLVVSDYLRSLFPDGYYDVLIVNRGAEQGAIPRRRRVSIPAPFHPADVFGACALLLSRSGAYSQFAVKVSDTPAAAMGYELSGADIEEAIQLGKRWRLNLDVPNETPSQWQLRRLEVQEEVATRWRQLVEGESGLSPIYDRSQKQSVDPQAWWITAHKLLISADEAARGIVDFSNVASGGDSYWRTAEEVRYVQSYKLVEDAKHGLNNGSKYAPPVGSSIAPSLGRDFGCVQPKRRTPMIGCTVRTLSNNLSLVPARGVVRTALYGNPVGGHVGTRGLNVLLIPFPFQIKANWFRPSKPAGYGEVGGSSDTRNSMFTLEQQWLERDGKPLTPEILAFVDAMLIEARQDVGEVHAVVFPEYSLTWEIYKELSDHLRKEHVDVEFLVAGSSTNCQVGDAPQPEGNFAFSSYFFDDPNSDHRFSIDTSRPKHHRWRLDRTQIDDYALASSLDPRRWWWEDINIAHREVYFHHFRENSIYSVMICEDLARSEPCHDLLRAVAPNLLFVLLMDGPQLPGRWPARYATVLAEDPGTSVLTLTSRGLIARSNKTGNYDPNWNIALWKDDKGPTRAISCPPGSQGVVLTLSGEPRVEMSIDSRKTKSVAWRYNGSQPVSLDQTIHLPLLKAVGAI